jgi:23S rRNA (adenine2503-C2)-methyltransferase
VLEVLAALPGRVPAAGLMPCVSTIAPCGSEPFFERVLEIKQRLYPGRFQLQFSLHTTDEAQRGRLIPARCWSYPQIAAFGSRFHQRGERKVTLNFAAAAGLPLEPQQLGAVFDPAHFAVKLTPINPTHAATASGLSGQIDPASPATGEQCAAAFRAAGFETILSIGDVRENLIGSNCGMYVQRMQSGSRTQA